MNHIKVHSLLFYLSAIIIFGGTFSCSPKDEDKDLLHTLQEKVEDRQAILFKDLIEEEVSSMKSDAYELNYQDFQITNECIQEIDSAMLIIFNDIDSLLSTQSQSKSFDLRFIENQLDSFRDKFLPKIIEINGQWTGAHIIGLVPFLLDTTSESRKLVHELFSIKGKKQVLLLEQLKLNLLQDEYQLIKLMRQRVNSFCNLPYLNLEVESKYFVPNSGVILKIELPDIPGHKVKELDINEKLMISNFKNIYPKDVYVGNQNFVRVHWQLPNINSKTYSFKVNLSYENLEHEVIDAGKFTSTILLNKRN